MPDVLGSETGRRLARGAVGFAISDQSAVASSLQMQTDQPCEILGYMENGLPLCMCIDRHPGACLPRTIYMDDTPRRRKPPQLPVFPLPPAKKKRPGPSPLGLKSKPASAQPAEETATSPPHWDADEEETARQQLARLLKLRDATAERADASSWRRPPPWMVGR